MNNVLVTGAAGFIGAHLVRELLTKGLNVVALDDLSGGYLENLPSNITFIKGSVTDQSLVTNIFEKHRFKYVYHLAAYAAEGLSHFIRRFNYTNNLIGSINLINESIKYDVNCFVFTSSIAVYGTGQVPLREDMTPHPEDPYGIAKYAFELDLKAAYEMFGLKYVIFRPHNVYGEFQNIGDRYRNVIGIFMNQVMLGNPITIFGDGEQLRAFSYVGDIIGPIAHSPLTTSAHQRVFNIGSDIPCSVNTLAKLVAETLGKPDHPVQHLPPRNEVKIAYSEHSAADLVFSHRTNTSLEEGIERMARWVKRTGPRSTARFDDIEIYMNLPPSWA